MALILSVLAAPMNAFASDSSGEGENKVNPKEIIFEHLGDAYGWEVPFNHHKRIPLPVIVYASDHSYRQGWRALLYVFPCRARSGVS